MELSPERLNATISLFPNLRLVTLPYCPKPLSMKIGC